MYNMTIKIRSISFILTMKNIIFKKMIKNQYSLYCLFIIFLHIFCFTNSADASNTPYKAGRITIFTDTIPLKDRQNDFINDKSNNPFDINTSLLEQKVEYDIISGKYIVYEKIGEQYYRTPTYLTFEEYLDWKAKEQEKDYFRNLAGIQSNKKSSSGKLDPMAKIDISKSLVDRMFGGTEVNVKPQGGIDLTVGFFTYYRTFPNFGNSSPFNPLDPIDIKPRLSVDGNVGTKMKLGFQYDAQSSFDFDRKIKLQYDSDAFSEDDIIKKIEAGNVSLPLKGNLIQGAQSLMGLKTDLQFGHLRMTLLASQQRSKQNNIKIENGASIQEFDIPISEYDENRHFFLSHFNRESYEDNLKFLPQVVSPFRIAQIEVYISDDRPDYQVGQTNIAAIADLGVGDIKYFTNKNANYTPGFLSDTFKLKNGRILADNKVNPLYSQLVSNDTIADIDKLSTILKTQFGMQQNRDFETFRGRLLSSSEYTYNAQLGYISLNIRLRPNQMLGVAYRYFYTDVCDAVYSVGQTSGQSLSTNERSSSGLNRDTTSVSKSVFVKLLKSSKQSTKEPAWDLMMKNVYNLRTAQLNKEGFQLDIFYEDDFSDGSLKKFIPEPEFSDKPLLNVFRLDNLNRFNDPQSDGIFDYVPGITVNERSGSIIFPVLEPFDQTLVELLGDKAGKYRYDRLYDTSFVMANQNQNLKKNKFRLIGRVKSSTSGEINLGPFVPRDGVRVSAGSIQLQEGSDYEIDYSLGKLRILNPAYLAQGTPINVSFEDQSAFSTLNKSMMGARFDYDFSKKFTMGATYLRLQERPFTQKVNIGDDPIKNRMFGLDLSYSDKTPWVTNILDKLPFFSTKEESLFNLSAEAAYLKPGHNKAINSQANSKDDGGIINIDDFESSVSGLSLGGINANSWILCSTPYEFPESKLNNNLTYGANRAKLSWYQIDQSVATFGPDSIKQLDQRNPYTRLLLQTDLFRRQVQTGFNQLFTFDVSYYPEERGPYNFDLPEGYSGYTSGTVVEGNEIKLKDPESRWGGMMRYFPNSDFEANNYQFIEFYMLNPFMDSAGRPIISDESGEIVFQLGNVSEDVLKDNIQFFENAVDSLETGRSTAWGNIPTRTPLINGFELQNISQQDRGFDGLTDVQERAKYATYLQKYETVPSVSADPSGDNFLFYNDESLQGKPLVERLKNFSGPQGNTPQQSNFDDNRFYRGSRLPDSEDLNNNRSLDQGESFYEYRIKIKNNGGEIDTVDNPYFKQVTSTAGNEKWYRFVVPIDGEFKSKVNDIEGFRAIQFMKMYFTKFQTQKIFRFAEFQLLRNQWRVTDSLTCNSDIGLSPSPSLDEVGVEENSNRSPFRYLTPKGIQQEEINSSFGANLRQDEKSLALTFQKLGNGCQVAINKVAKIDLNLYKRLQLIVHAEAKDLGTKYKHGDLSVYIRLGKDRDLNYYEYEMPLKFSEEKNQAIENIWPDTNYVDIPLSGFVSLKKQKIESGGSILAAADPENAGATFRMRGTPSLGYIKIVEIGFRNTSGENIVIEGQTWVNELRASGLNEDGAWAAQAKAQLKLADLGDMNLAANYSSIGWGGLDQRLLERQREEVFQFDASTSLQLGKLLPKFLPVSLPFFASYSKSIKNYQYDPYQRDITVKEFQTMNISQQEKDDATNRAKETSTIKSFNFTNVKKEGGGKGNKPWNLENISGTYSYTQTLKTDPIISEELTTEKKTGLDYGFSTRPKYIQLFKFIKPKALKIISEFNFNLIPTSIGFNTNLERYSSYRTFRLPVQPIFRFDDQRYKWDRNYTLDWDFTKSLRMTFRANATAVVDELRQVGIANNIEERKWVNERNVEQAAGTNQETADRYRSENFRRLGRAKNYTHNFGLTYKLPINLLPLMDWVTSNADYKSSYTWTAGALSIIDTDGSLPGNIIQNTQNRSLNANFSFDRLYSKWGYLKKIETGNKNKTKKAPKEKTTKDAEPKGLEGRNKDTKEEGEKEDKNGENDKDSKKANKKRAKGEREVTMVERILIRPLLALRTVKFNYKEDFSTSIPGFNPESKLFGLSEGFAAPGWEFAAGLQPDLAKNNPNNFLRSNQQWFNKSVNFNDQILQTYRQNINAKVNLEPFKDFKIDVDFNKDYKSNHSEIFKYKDEMFTQQANIDGGSFESTYFSMRTLFGDERSNLNRFLENLKTVSNIYGNPDLGRHEKYSKYTYGYGPQNFAVVTPAFLAAYTGIDVRSQSFDVRSNIKSYDYIPKPNWILRYDGLSKLSMFKNVFNSVSIRHGYKSTLSVANFLSQALYDENKPFQIDDNINYYSQIEIPAISIKEDFSPLIGVDIKTKNNMDIKFEYKRGRQLDLRASNGELSETLSSSFVFGYGYIIENFKGFGRGSKARDKKKSKKANVSTEPEKDDEDNKGKGKSKTANNKGKKLTINADFSFKDDKSQIYKYYEEGGGEPQTNRGARSIQFSPNVEYQMYKNLALRFYFEYTTNKPYTPNAYKNSNISAGTIVRYTFN
ncbi:MAG: hypothetical protein RLZZ546_148 [Bacteroidota bacterium]